MYNRLKHRLTYTDVLREADSRPYGDIVISVDDKPIIIKHPHEEQWLIIGYNKETGKVAFVELHEYGTHRKINSDDFRERWRTVDNTEIIIKSTSERESVFIQEFLFLFGYKWNGKLKAEVNQGLGLIRSGGREVFIYANTENRKGYLTYSDTEPGASRKWMNFKGFWDMYIKIIAIW